MTKTVIMVFGFMIQQTPQIVTTVKSVSFAMTVLTAWSAITSIIHRILPTVLIVNIALTVWGVRTVLAVADFEENSI